MQGAHSRPPLRPQSGPWLKTVSGEYIDLDMLREVRGPAQLPPLPACSRTSITLAFPPAAPSHPQNYPGTCCVTLGEPTQIASVSNPASYYASAPGDTSCNQKLLCDLPQTAQYVWMCGCRGGACNSECPASG